MKVFQLKHGGETTLIAANTNVHALRFWCNHNMQSLMHDLEDEDDIEEVPKEEWPNIKVKNTEYDSSNPNDKEFYTLEELMTNVKEAEFISSTTFE